METVGGIQGNQQQVYTGGANRAGAPTSASINPKDQAVIGLGSAPVAAGETSHVQQNAAPLASQPTSAGSHTPQAANEPSRPTAASMNTATSLFVELDPAHLPTSAGLPTGPAGEVNAPSAAAPTAAPAQTEAPAAGADPAAQWYVGPKARLVTTKTAVDTLSKISDAVNLADAEYCQSFGAQPDRSAILLTGPTGVGKTAGIKCLASYTGNPLVRINLHDNTDELELFGGYKPNPQGPGFIWVDGLVTQAVRNGYWLMMDEVNLAEPAVLERLNALLDGDDFIKLTEKADGEVVRCHPDTRVFATMNPSSYEGRKDLSAAMLDRFKKKIWVDALPPEEMVQVVKAMDITKGLVASKGMKWEDALNLANKFVTGNHDEDPLTKDEEKLVNSIPSRLDDKLLMSLAMFHSKIALMCENRELGKKGGPYPFTLRDLLKLVDRVDTDRKIRPNQDQQKLMWRHVLDIYVNRFMADVDRDRVLDQAGINLFGSAKNRPPVQVDGGVSKNGNQITIGDTTLEARPFTGDKTARKKALIPDENPNFTWTKSTVDKMAGIARSALLDEPVLVVGPTAAGKTAGIRQLAAMVNTPVVRINLSMGTDTSQLIGGYYPVERDTSQSFQFKNGVLINTQTNKPVEGKYALKGDKLVDLNSGQAMFEWRDGSLVEAMKQGKWVILDEINLAEPSVLERLNSLLDPDRIIVLSEKDGEKVTADKNFRLFATMNPATGEYEGRNELSPAMRNRFTERWYPEITERDELIQITQKMFQGTQKVSGMDLATFSPKALAPMPDSWGKKMAELCVDAHLALRKKADSGELQTAHKDGYRFTIRGLETLVRFIRTHPDGLVAPDPKNIKKTITYDWKKTFADAIKYAYADGLREADDRKAVEALGQQYAQKV